MPELFHGECELRDRIAARSLPAQLKDDFLKGKLAAEEAMQRISESLARLDPTLVRAAKAPPTKCSTRSIDWRSGRPAELRRNEVIARHATQIENSLYPRKTLQEREIAASILRQVWAQPDRPADRVGASSLPRTQGTPTWLNSPYMVQKSSPLFQPLPV